MVFMMVICLVLGVSGRFGERSKLEFLGDWYPPHRDWIRAHRCQLCFNDDGSFVSKHSNRVTKSVVAGTWSISDKSRLKLCVESIDVKGHGGESYNYTEHRGAAFEFQFGKTKCGELILRNCSRSNQTKSWLFGRYSENGYIQFAAEDPAVAEWERTKMTREHFRQMIELVKKRKKEDAEKVSSTEER